jgi:predicted NAD/FAD-binding protein
VRLLWKPLCLAALNTPIEQASAQVFLNVLRDSFSADKEASALLLPRCDLSTLFPEPAADYVQRHGGTIRLGETVLRIEHNADAFSVTSASGLTHHRAVILATQPSRVPNLTDRLPYMAQAIAQIRALTFQPIVTIYLQYAQRPRLPMPMLGLAGRYTQWLFDREVIWAQPGLIAAVISARGHHSDVAHATLAQAYTMKLRPRFAAGSATMDASHRRKTRDLCRSPKPGSSRSAHIGAGPIPGRHIRVAATLRR